MSKVNQLLPAIGFGLFSYLFIQAAGYSLTHYQPYTILEVQARYHHYIMPFVILAASSGFLCLGRIDLVCQDDYSIQPDPL